MNIVFETFQESLQLYWSIGECCNVAFPFAIAKFPAEFLIVYLISTKDQDAPALLREIERQEYIYIYVCWGSKLHAKFLSNWQRKGKSGLENQFVQNLLQLYGSTVRQIYQIQVATMPDAFLKQRVQRIFLEKWLLIVQEKLHINWTARSPMHFSSCDRMRTFSGSWVVPRICRQGPLSRSSVGVTFIVTVSASELETTVADNVTKQMQSWLCC